MMPTIEAILQEEGINSRCIALQMAGIKERCKQRLNSRKILNILNNCFKKPITIF